MVRTAILKVDDFRSDFPDGIKVLSCDYSFTKEINQRGEAIGITQGGIINLQIGSVDSSTLMSWMYQPIRMNGTITISDGSGDANATLKIFKTIKFEDAYLVGYHEAFSDGGMEMMINLTISSKKITISGKLHENIWTKRNDN